MNTIDTLKIIIVLKGTLEFMEDVALLTMRTAMYPEFDSNYSSAMTVVFSLKKNEKW